MNFFHLNCRIIGKAGVRSSVAVSAYISGEKLLNERTGLTHDFSRKKDVIFSDTVLCKNAPSAFKHRETLWNSVEQVEKASNSRFARQFDLAIPNEFSVEQAKELFYSVAEIFTNQGMCFDGGIHWEEGNHHFDFLVTTRPFNEDGSWGQKDKKDYIFKTDESGNKIINKEDPNWWEDSKNPDRCGIRIPELDENGKQKLDKKGGRIWKRDRVDSTGWDKNEMVEYWRSECCKAINISLNKYGFDYQLDHRSYERQGIDKMPTIHEGYHARKMEAQGEISDRCNINREIREYNKISEQIKSVAKELTDKIIQKARDIIERFTNLTGGIGIIRDSGTDGRSSGDTADRNRGFEAETVPSKNGFSDIEGFFRRSTNNKRRASETKRAIDETDKFIEDTDHRIEEILRNIQLKEAERNDRISKLLQRRSASKSTGTDANRGRAGQGSDIRTGEADKHFRDTTKELSAFISSIRTQVSTSESGRQEREAEQRRLDSEREREAEGQEPQVNRRKTRSTRTSRGDDFSL